MGVDITIGTDTCARQDDTKLPNGGAGLDVFALNIGAWVDIHGSSHVWGVISMLSDLVRLCKALQIKSEKTMGRDWLGSL